MRDQFGRFVKGFSSSPLTQFRKGQTSPRKGVIVTKEIRKKMSLARLGKTPWNKDRIGYSTAKKGYKMPEETKKKISAYQQGKSLNEWQGYVSSQDKMERVKFRQKMQKLIFERDNYTCQICGSKKNLQVDHIQPWAEYIELRFKIENCRTLCAPCHYFITFGKPMPRNIKGWGHHLLKGGY